MSPRTRRTSCRCATSRCPPWWAPGAPWGLIPTTSHDCALTPRDASHPGCAVKWLEDRHDPRLPATPSTDRIAYREAATKKHAPLLAFLSRCQPEGHLPEPQSRL